MRRMKRMKKCRCEPKKNVNNEIPDFDSRVRHAWERWGKNSLKDEKKKKSFEI